MPTMWALSCGCWYFKFYCPGSPPFLFMCEGVAPPGRLFPPAGVLPSTCSAAAGAGHPDCGSPRGQEPEAPSSASPMDSSVPPGRKGFWVCQGDWL